jgi:hypothetical protein
MPRTQVFISYSHRDAAWLKLLQTQLAPLIRSDVISVWDDTRIKPGAEWRREIDAALAATKVAVLLVSADFLASDFIAQYELPPIFAAANAGVRILWVPVKASLYEVTDLVKYQAVIDPAHPLESLKGAARTDALVKIARAIRDALAEPAPDQAAAPPSAPPRAPAPGPSPDPRPSGGPPALTGAQRQQLAEALLSAFTHGSLERMLSFKLDVNLAAVAGSGNLTDVVFDLVTWSEAQGRTRELIVAARESNPGNPALRAIADELGV